MKNLMKYSSLHDFFLVNYDDCSLCGDMIDLTNLLNMSLFLLATEFLKFNIQDKQPLNF